MPRHSPNALTSHLRVHTTNDNPDIPAVGIAFSVAMMRMIVFFLSQILHALSKTDDRQTVTRLSFINHTNAASIEKPIHNVKVPMNGAETPSQTRPEAGTVVFISGTTFAASHRQAAGNGGAYRDRTDDPLLAKQVLSQLS